MRARLSRTVALVAFAIALIATPMAIAQRIGIASPQTRFDTAIAGAKAAMLVNPNTALSDAKSAEAYAETIGDVAARGLAKAQAEWLQGEAYLRMNDVERAAAPIDRALVLVTKLAPKSKLYADVLLSHGGIAGAKGQVGGALRDYQAAFATYRALNDTRSQAIALLFIASLYGDATDQITALKYYDQAIQIYKSDINLLISVYNNRGSTLRELKRYDEADAQFVEALALAQRLRSDVLQVQVENNLARVRLDAGRIDAADSAIAQGLRIMGTGDIGGWRGQLIATSAQAALQRGQTARAAKLVGDAFANVDPKTTTLSFRDSHATAYATYAAVGDAPAALVHLQALRRLDGDATKLAINTNTALMAARFDFANQELRIAQLKQDELQRSIAFEQARAQTQRTMFLGASAAVSIIIGMLVFALVTIRRSRDKVRAANDDMAIANAALSKALAAKTEFLATTSHEIRTPLNGILGMTQVMLADPKLAPAMRDRLGIVHGAGVTMRALVDDILDVAKMETGNLTIESAPFDLRATVTDATRMWEEQARAKGLTFDVDLASCPAMVMGDAARVRQIVFNLLSNALKFTGAGRVGLSVRAVDGDLHVDVSDSGIGIPVDKLEEIFESFRQADAGTTRQFGGTGLGLSICRNLARAMGGDVTVASVVGEGTTFSLILPLILATAVARDAGVIAGEAVTLIVDRNPITRSMFKTLLAPHSDAVLVATSTQDAIARLDEARGSGGVATILIDDATIRAEGDALEALRSVVAVAGYAKTIVLWPMAAMAERESLLATGITRVVAKPVSGSALIAAMFPDPVSNNHAILDLVSHAA